MGNIQKIKPSGIFTNYIFKSIPLAFDESLSYYEVLCGVLDLLKTQEEIINNNADLLAELENYVNTYFENLDIQEEVNNKLDEMAESGELENLISQYIELVTTYVYNNVAEMKLAENLVNGSFARTSGFYSYNDEGGAFYKIRTITNEDVIDEETLFALHNNTLVAELVKQSEMNIKQFGGKGDGETNETTLIQKALNFTNNLIIQNGTYMIDASIGLYLVSNSYIKLVNATLKAIPNNLDTYKIIYIHGVDNVIIEGGTIEGERSNHTGETGEWGHCIHISSNSNNITIKNCNIKNAWGDGLYINRAFNVNSINNVYTNNRRQGISVIRVDGFHSLNDIIKDTNGTSPESAIDIEPNANNDFIKNVVLENLYTENNNGCGVDIYLPALTGSNDYVDIRILNHHDKGSKTGEKISVPATIRHSIITENALLENNNTGINLRDCFDNTIDKVLIIRPKIINCNYDTSITASYVCGIGGYTTQETTDKLGGVTIFEPFITSMFNTARRGITFYDTTNTSRCNNIDLIDPLNHQSNLSIAIYGDNLVFTDKYNKYKRSDNSTSLQSSQLYSRVSNINFTSGRTIALSESLPIGYSVTFVNEKISYRFKLQFADTDYCRYFNSNTGNLIQSDSMNSLITITKIADHEWIVENIVGEFSVSV